MRRRIITTLLIAGTLAAGLVQIHATGITQAATLVVLALAVSVALAPAPTTDHPWPAPGPDRRAGGRTDVSDLAWAAYTRDGTATTRVLHRIRRIAAHRLAAHGITWDARPGPGTEGWSDTPDDGPAHRERAAQLLGPDVLASLTSARPVTPRTLEAWFRALDALVTTPDTTRRTS